MAINNLTLTGRLTADPELRQTNSGELTTSFILAVERKMPDKDGRKAADFPMCVAWGKTAEFICRYCRKGTKLEIIAEIRTRKYEDRSGTKHYITEILVKSADFGESKKSQGTEKASSQEPNTGAEYLSDFEEFDVSELPF